MSKTSAVAAAAVVAPKPPSVKNAFATFEPSMLSRPKDGGSIIVDGRILGGVKVTVRLDGAIGSPTRGQFFSLTQPAKGNQPGRRMTTAELKDLNKAITAHMAKTPGRQADYEVFNKRIRDAIGGTEKKVNVEKISTNLIGPNASATVDGSIWFNGFPGPGPITRRVIASVRLEGAGFNDALPKFGVKKVEIYERTTNKLIASVTNPKATPGNTGVAGKGMSVSEFRLEIPRNKVDFNAQYAFVVTSSINGSQPKQVRSDFKSIAVAH